MSGGELIIYQTEDGLARIHLQATEGTVWLTQSGMAELFNTSRQNINIHLKSIFEDRELLAEAVVKESLTTASDGKQYRTKAYNLEAILAVGFRVRSLRGSQFQRWANPRFNERDLLVHTGKLQMEVAQKLALERYDKFDAKRKKTDAIVADEADIKELEALAIRHSRESGNPERQGGEGE